MNYLNTSGFSIEFDFMVKNTILGHFQDGGSAHGLLGAILDFAQNEISTISKYSMENSDPNSGFKNVITQTRTRVIAPQRSAFFGKIVKNSGFCKT